MAKLSPSKQGQEAAEKFRVEHQLGFQPLSDLVSLIEQTTGIEVAIIDAGPDEHGLTMRDPIRNVVYIGVARTPHLMRQRSTLAHELAHAIFGDWVDGTPGARTPEEIRADSFARHLLVPNGGLRAVLGNISEITEVELSRVVQHFLVSPALAAIALSENQYITQETKDEWMRISTGQLAFRHGWHDQYTALQAGSKVARFPQRLFVRAIEGYRQGVISAQTIAGLTGISLEELNELFENSEVFPIEPDVPVLAAADLPEVEVDFSFLDDDDTGCIAQ